MSLAINHPTYIGGPSCSRVVLSVGGFFLFEVRQCGDCGGDGWRDRYGQHGGAAEGDPASPETGGNGGGDFRRDPTTRRARGLIKIF